MSDKGTKITFGGRQARALCNMSHSERLDFIAEGLPIMLQSAQGFWRAAETLESSQREAAVLAGFAEEESAKALILIDLVRCPKPEVGKRIGRIVKKTLYDHLSRMIYAKAQSWLSANVAQLQEYIDHERQGHYLEGGMSEYIVPNWSLYQRESTMYADIEVHEEGIPQWNDPNRWSDSTMMMRPIALDLVEALEALGVLTHSGLQAPSEVWSSVDFVNDEGPVEARELTKQLAARLDSEGLISDCGTEQHARLLFNHWQLPMYNMDFDLIHVPLEQLEAERDAAFWNEVGGY
jgi:hypothetical protein